MASRFGSLGDVVQTIPGPIIYNANVIKRRNNSFGKFVVLKWSWWKDSLKQRKDSQYIQISEIKQDVGSCSNRREEHLRRALRVNKGWGKLHLQILNGRATELGPETGCSFYAVVDRDSRVEPSLSYTRAAFTSNQLCFLSFFPQLLLEREDFIKVLAYITFLSIHQQKIADLCSVRQQNGHLLIVICVSICLNKFITNISSGSTTQRQKHRNMHRHKYWVFSKWLRQQQMVQWRLESSTPTCHSTHVCKWKGTLCARLFLSSMILTSFKICLQVQPTKAAFVSSYCHIFS